MDSEEMAQTNDHRALEKPAEFAENMGKCNNIVTNVSDKPVNIEDSKKIADDPVIISNGSVDKLDCSVEKVANDVQHLNINLPSTSGVAGTSRSYVKPSRSIVMNADEIDNEDFSPSAIPHSQPNSHDRPNALPLEKTKRRVLKISPEDISSPDSPMSEDENKFISPETDSQDELENSIMVILNNSQQLSDMIPELTFDEEQAELRNWKACTIAGVKRQIDLKVIEPYKRVLSHGGYLNTGSHNAIITFSACFLPHKSRKDYSYVMDNFCLLYTSPSPRDRTRSRMPSSA